VFLAGTNLLCSDMEKNSQWCIKPNESFWKNKVTLLGLGWWQYQEIDPNAYTRYILSQTLNREKIHSARDSYTSSRLAKLGFRTVNTGCPTLWWLTEEHCYKIPDQKSDRVLLTFTEYNMAPQSDRLLFDVLSRNYSTIYVWPQMYGDYDYAQKICGNRITFIDPSLEALDDLLQNEQIDYVGTRLHAGVRALQHQRRSIIITVDNRAIEMGKDFNLPIVNRSEIATKLEERIRGTWKTEVRIDREAIETWKSQFVDRSLERDAGKLHSKNTIDTHFHSLKLIEPEIDKEDRDGLKQLNLDLEGDGNDSRIAYVKKVIESLNSHQNQEALDLLESEKLEQSPELYLVKAIALSRLEKFEEAIADLQYLLSQKPSLQKAQLLLHEISEASIETSLNRAKNLINENKEQEALPYLNQAKSLKQPTPQLDYLRAICFLKLNQRTSALQSLYEELRYFPKNAEAKALQERLLAKEPSFHAASIQDQEFQEILKTVRPYTMLSEARLYSLFSLVKRICTNNIPGNIVECGVAGGGSTALMAAVIKRYSKQPRWLYAFDSFDGMPTPTAEDKHNGIHANDTGWGTGTCAAPETSVREICAKLGVSEIVKTVKGYFQETLPKMRNPVGMIALLHMDGDWYESTQTILQNLYDRVVNDGLIQVDDYGYWEGCRQAIHEFAQSHNLKFTINPIDDTGVWFVKPDKFPVNSTIEPTLLQEFAQEDPVKHGIQSQMSANERFQLYYTLRKLLPQISSPLRFIEIGSYAGSSLFLMCQALRKVTPQLQGFAIDPGVHPQLIQVLQHLKNEVTHLRMFSHHAMPQLKELFDRDGNRPTFILVDGDHTYEGVRQDILNYYPLLASGGIMLFHDYLPPLDEDNREAILFHHAGNEPGIRQACQELMENTYSCEVLELPLLYPSDPTQTQAHLPIIPGVFSSIRVYRKPGNVTL
ncbi:MAG: TylF/MycF/NovP-related O-methyltransferase, partial [Geitlerinemataceae cyanobacterium]